jgi:phosphoribosyl-ATP pyrophosphohydrolase/phosphoribosyl-AMP cyclohydrolase
VTGEVLMVAGWITRALAKPSRPDWLRTTEVASRRALWRKRETSEHEQHVDGVYADCDGDTLLVQVHQEGVACHTGARTCFFTRLEGGEAPALSGAGPAMLEVLERVLQSRKVERPEGSYTAGLFARGETQICRKIGEEATEVVTAALGGEGDPRVISEVADLWFHTMVLLVSRGIPLRRVFEELAARHGEKSR